ncbi:hypothetical protein [Hymenobacter mucosus]|uniref:Uncharacterized protein n=1 Tax=Hymenobacter mucosus TaxID=1411120 RepID=A0A239A8T7_9BACT|nr:hypothetical protein [Hymenobacter mucosus]SNR91980.1 hypothetical protein SAMN06269173_11166 [Hymenobacter mucosus]
MNARIAAQLRAQGVDPGTLQPLKRGNSPVAPSLPPGSPIPPLTPVGGQEGVKNKGKTTGQELPTLRPRFQIATHAGYPGLRMVLWGLTDEQVQHLRTAALGIGVLEQN